MKISVNLSIVNCLKATIIVAMVYFLLYSKAMGVIAGFFPVCVAAIILEMAVVLYSSNLTLMGSCSKILFVLWVLFYCLELIVGLIISDSLPTMMSFLIESVGYCAVAMAIVVVSNTERSFKWFFKAMVIMCTLGALYQMLFGGQYWNTMYVTTLSGNDNPNSLGIMMLLGIISSYFLFNEKKKWNELWIAFSLLFLYSIILTGSRKSFIVAIILMAIFLVIYINNLFKTKGSSLKKIVFVILILILIVLGVYYFSNVFLGTSMYKRLVAAMNWESSIRANMYREAFQFFRDHPIFGLGFGQYAVLSSFHTYSHSTYAELLACTGIIGTILYLFPFLFAILKSMQNIWRRNITMKNSLIAMVGLIGLLILGLGIILPYEFEPIIFAVILFNIIDNDIKKKEPLDEYNK